MILILASLFVPAFLRAEPPVAPPAPKKLVAEIRKSRGDLESVEIKQRQVLSALYQLNKKIHHTVSEKSKLQGERAALEDNVNRLNERLKELDATSSALRARLGERLKAIHRLGGLSLARILSSASSASSLDRNLKILGLVAARDRDLVVDYRRVRADIKAKHRKVANRLARLKGVEAKVKERESRFVAEQETKSRILDGIRKKHLFAQQSLEDLRRQTRASASPDDALLDSLFRPSFADEKGKLDPPVEGRIVHKFGSEKSAEQPWTISRKGLRFAAAAGDSVKAVFDGVVAWVGDVPGFGRSIVVDHGDHYYSVYANAGEVRVKPGDEIRRRQVVATAGLAALEEGAGLYFEIRHFSEPYDPQLWLKGTAL